MWVPHVARALCVRMEATEAIPHVLAGMETVLRRPGPVPEGGRQYAALIMALFFWVQQRLEERQWTGASLKEQRVKMGRLLAEMREDPLMESQIGGSWTAWEEPRSEHVNAWIRNMAEAGIFEQDWAQNVGLGGQMEDSAVPSDVDVDDSSSQADLDRMMGYGLGTMRQPEVDFLSRDKLARHEEWMAAIRVRIGDMVCSE